MKAVIITLALAGLVTTASADAQILGTRLPTPSTSRTTVNGSWEVIGRDGSGYTIYERRVRDANGNIVVQRARRDSNGNMTIISSRVETNANVGGNYGSWQVVGRDANGYTIYERRTTDRYGNIVIQRARRESNGNMTIISSRTVASNDRNNRNCDYNRTSNSVGDIIFGRTNDVNCDDVGNRVNDGWYQVGRGRDNNSIYERRTTVNGRLVIQRARRNSDGTFRILSTRYANDNDKQWQKAEKKREKEYRKEQKEQDKEYRKAQKEQDKDYKKEQHDQNKNYKNH
jgi:hypothetical protein